MSWEEGGNEHPFQYLPCSNSFIRYDLDFLEQADKFADHFHVTLDLVVSERDRPMDKQPPWVGFETQRLTSKYCFADKDEQDMVIAQYGMFGCEEKVIQKVCTVTIPTLARFKVA